MLGRIIRDLVPTGDNNRNSEGAFITLKDGRILFIFSRYGAGGADDGALANLYGMISTDNGESFGDPYPILYAADFGADNLMSTSLLRMQNGDIGLFFLMKTDVEHCRLFLTRSADEGATWSEPVLCTDPRGYFVVNNDRVIRTATGRLLAPAARHPLTCKINEAGKKVFDTLYPGLFTLFASDDDGDTWRKITDDTPMPPARGITSGAQEPGLLPLEDGRIWCYIRNDSGRQYECWSNDDGTTWSEPTPSPFTSPVSPMCTKRLSTGEILVVWNPIPLYNGRSQFAGGVWTGGRTPLAIAISRDDGKTFTDYQAAEDDPDHGYCYTAIHEAPDGNILLAYCAGGPEDGGTLNKLRIKKIDRSELMAL